MSWYTCVHVECGKNLHFLMELMDGFTTSFAPLIPQGNFFSNVLCIFSVWSVSYFWMQAKVIKSPEVAMEQKANTKLFAILKPTSF